MKTRVLFGSLLIGALSALLALDVYLERLGVRPVGLAAGAIVLALAVFASLELARLLKSAGFEPHRLPATIGAAAAALTPIWRQWLPGRLVDDGGAYLLALVAALIGAFAAQMASGKPRRAGVRVGATLLIVLYVGLLASATLAVRVRFGAAALILLLLATKFMDIGAYLVGSRIGRHKMIPWLSPGKSWEGLAGGSIAAAGAAILVSLALRIEPLSFIIPVWAAGLFGLIVGLVGQFGDFCESLLKRDAGAKDSGALIPEFGGVLDLVDSPLMAGAAGYVFFALLLP